MIMAESGDCLASHGLIAGTGGVEANGQYTGLLRGWHLSRRRLFIIPVAVAEPGLPAGI